MFPERKKSSRTTSSDGFLYKRAWMNSSGLIQNALCRPFISRYGDGGRGSDMQWEVEEAEEDAAVSGLFKIKVLIRFLPLFTLHLLHKYPQTQMHETSPQWLPRVFSKDKLNSLLSCPLIFSLDSFPSSIKQSERKSNTLLELGRNLWTQPW